MRSRRGPHEPDGDWASGVYSHVNTYIISSLWYLAQMAVKELKKLSFEEVAKVSVLP